METHTHMDRIGKRRLATYSIGRFDLLLKIGLLLALTPFGCLAEGACLITEARV